MGRNLLYIIVALLTMVFVACKEEDKTDTIVTPDQNSASTLKPVGTISGKVIDRHTEKPVKGAIVSIAFNGSVTKATTDESGSFSFANVPCNRDATTGIITGTYQLTVSLVEVNKTIPDTLPKYREFYYNASLSVTFIDLAKNDTSKNKLPVENLEANIWFEVAKLNTTINGVVVDEKYEPAVNATVWLREGATGDVIQRTTTDNQGKYSFTKVEDGITVFIEARSADGELRGTNPPFTLVINRTVTTLYPQVTADRIVLTPVDNVDPYVVSISPENLEDVSPTNLKVVYRFSESIKQTAYTVTTAPQGLGTLIDDIQFNFISLKKSAAGNTNFTLAWDSTYRTLTITPSGIVGSGKYQVNIATALGKLTDRAGRSVAPRSIIGDFETLTFTTNGGAPLPSAPTVIRRLNTGLGFNLLNFTGGTVGLEWNMDNNARNYRVYRSIDGQPFVLLADNITDVRYTDNTGVLVTSYNPPADRDPFKAFTVRYKVVGVSKDLVEGPESAIITVQDDVAPRLISAVVDSSTTGFDYIYLRFDEPLAIATAQTTSNYNINNLPGDIASTISEAVYLGWTGSSYEVRLRVTEHSIKANEVITVTNQVKDLIGNAIDPNNNWLTF